MTGIDVRPRVGIFAGSSAYAAVLTDEGNIEDALVWLRKALAGGNLNFLRVASQALMGAIDPRIQALAARIPLHRCRTEFEPQSLEPLWELSLLAMAS